MESADVSEQAEQKGFWTSVTPFSKYLALSLFVLLPVAAFWFGTQYGPVTVVEVGKVIVKKSPDNKSVTQTEQNRFVSATPTSTLINTNNGFSFEIPSTWDVEIGPHEETIVSSVGEDAQRITLFNELERKIGFVECRVNKTYEYFETRTFFSETRNFVKNNEEYKIYYSEEITNTEYPTDDFRITTHIYVGPLVWTTDDYSNQGSLFKPCQLFAKESSLERFSQSDIIALRHIYDSWTVFRKK